MNGLNIALIARRNEYSENASYLKKPGILSIKGKQLIWKSTQEPQHLTILTESITDKKKNFNPNKNTELLMIETKDNPRGYIFSFSGDNKTEIRNKFYDLLHRKDDEYEDCFRVLNNNEKKKLLQIFTDEYLYYLFEELVYKKPILSKEEYLNFIRKRYINRFYVTNVSQVIQLARDDEILFSEDFNIFNFKVKKKFLLSNDDLNLLYENYVSSLRREDNFWSEFLKNQKNNETQYFGGLKQIYFTSEDRSKISDLQNNTNNIYQKYKINKIYEDIERHRLYTYNYYGLCQAVSEFDYKDKEMKEINPTEEFNKKEISNLIENINNYSIRKLENIKYLPRHNLLTKIKKEEKKQVNTLPINRTNNINMNKIFTHVLEMKANHNKTIINIKDSIDAFKKINSNLILYAKIKNISSCKIEEESIMNEIKKLNNLFREIYFIHNTIKNAKFSDEQKRIKRNYVRSLSAEILEKISLLSNKSEMSKITLANFNIIKNYIDKVKGSN